MHYLFNILRTVRDINVLHMMSQKRVQLKDFVLLSSGEFRKEIR